MSSNEPRHEETNVLVSFPTWSDTNQAVQLQKVARGLKFRIKKVGGSKNKGADKLSSYREPDLCLCFRIYAKCWFSYDATQMMC